MDHGADSAALVVGLLLVLIGLALYLLPDIVAFSRHHRQATAIFVLDLLLGWTFLGWIAALVWALTNSPPQQVVSVQGGPGAAPGPPPAPPG